MGNHFGNMSSPERPQEFKKFRRVESFEFHDSFFEETNNGFYFNNVYLPEEVVMMILSYIDPKELLKATLVCKKWCNIIKSDTFWTMKYSRHFNKKPKKLPWYVYYCLFATNYFNENLIKNGNGQDNYKHWRIILNYGDAFKIEDPPAGSDPLPPDIPEFNGKTSCFATSYYECNKLQEISLENNRLMQLIFNKFKPHIYLSEWVAGRFDCGCVYTLWCKLYGKKFTEKSNSKRLSCHSSSSSDYSEAGDFQSNSSYEDFESNISDEDSEKPLYIQRTGTSIEQWAGSTWSKVELVVKDYPSGVKRIVFQHEGKDTQFWKGHYGSKMAGGVLKISFDSINPIA